MYTCTHVRVCARECMHDWGAGMDVCVHVHDSLHAFVQECVYSCVIVHVCIHVSGEAVSSSCN